MAKFSPHYLYSLRRTPAVADVLLRRTVCRCRARVMFVWRRDFTDGKIRRSNSPTDVHDTVLSTAPGDKHETMSYADSNEYLFQMVAGEDGRVSVSQLMRCLKNSGLWKNDPRLSESIRHIKNLYLERQSDMDTDVPLTLDMFRECIRDNMLLIQRAFSGDFVIPEFSTFCSTIDDIYWACRTHSVGKVSPYIPQLARYSPDHWGVSLCTIDGQRHSIGDVDVPFTIQSGSMPINYALATNEVGAEVVHQYVGHEPSGESVAYIKLNQDNKPHNPLINSGAIIVASLMKPYLFQRDMSPADKFDYILSQYRRLAGGETLGFNNAIFLAEKEKAHRNFALGYYMKENGCFASDVNLQQTMDLYFQLCAIELTVNTGAVLAGTLANGGYCPITGEKVLNQTSVRNTLSLMHSCGLYEYSGRFAFRVGLPAKSAISGCVLLVIPNVMGMCLWSPPLDKMGNSARCIKVGGKNT